MKLIRFATHKPYALFHNKGSLSKSRVFWQNLINFYHLDFNFGNLYQFFREIS